VAGLDITPRPGAGRQLITGYGDRGFRITGQRFEGSVITFPDHTVVWPVADSAGITFASLAEVVQAKSSVSVLIVGCGQRFAPPPMNLREQLLAQDIALEWMDTGAACRTYNVLVLDARDVAAALIAVD
jgi:Uncharacterized conserved protein